VAQSPARSFYNGFIGVKTVKRRKHAILKLGWDPGPMSLTLYANSTRGNVLAKDFDFRRLSDCFLMSDD
jgi:hypothetical protein